MGEPGFFDYLWLTGQPPRDSCRWRIKGKRDVYCGMPCAGHYRPEHQATIDRLQRHKNDCLDVGGLVGSRYSGAGFVVRKSRVGCLALPVGQYRKNYSEEMGSSSKSGSGD